MSLNSPAVRRPYNTTCTFGASWRGSSSGTLPGHPCESSRGNTCQTRVIAPRSATVSASTTNENRSDGTTQTLGDLLYADRAKVRVPERDWVELVQLIAARDELALRALYERTHRLVFTLIMRITSNRQTAEELTLDVFHDVWRRAATYDEHDGSVLGWILNQARSRAIDRLRFEQRKKRVNPRPDETPAAIAPGDSDDAVALAEQSRALQRALAVLTAEERLAIETAFFSELTYADAAAQLAQPVGTIKTRIRSALGKLRRALGTGANES
jgi:RNA polymerase sigma-70 factor (ECF subfamily)